MVEQDLKQSILNEFHGVYEVGGTVDSSVNIFKSLFYIVFLC